MAVDPVRVLLTLHARGDSELTALANSMGEKYGDVASALAELSPQYVEPKGGASTWGLTHEGRTEAARQYRERGEAPPSN